MNIDIPTRNALGLLCAFGILGEINDIIQINIGINKIEDALISR
jgi:hypothetical protein